MGDGGKPSRPPRGRVFWEIHWSGLALRDSTVESSRCHHGPGRCVAAGEFAAGAVGCACRGAKRRGAAGAAAAARGAGGVRRRVPRVHRRDRQLWRAGEGPQEVDSQGAQDDVPRVDDGGRGGAARDRRRGVRRRRPMEPGRLGRRVRQRLHAEPAGRFAGGDEHVRDDRRAASNTPSGAARGSRT